MTRQVMARKQCSRCNGEGRYLFVGSHDRESWDACPCSDRNNPAGVGYEVEWVEIEVKEGK